MLKQILYDRVINVTLYKPHKVTTAKYKTHVTQGYKEEVIGKAKRLYSVSQDDDVGDISINPEAHPTSSYIEFYQGNTRKIFIGYTKTDKGKTKEVYKLLKPVGNRYDVQTIEDMKKGVRPDGSPFESGDKVRVKADGSLWNVYRQGSVSSLYTEEDTETSIVEDATTIEVNTTNNGLKPDIAMSISLLPGQNCYGVVLKIRNLHLDAINIRDWTRMVIEAGYRTGAKARFTCPIFSSYIESPNPDGITTFEALTVGTAEGIMYDQYIEIHFLQEEMTLGSLIEGVAAGVAPGIKVKPYIDDRLLNDYIIHVSKQTVYAQNGMAVLNWLQSTVASFISTITNNEMSVLVQLVNEEIQIIALNGPNKKTVDNESIVNLDMVSGATFNGTALTVEAPWNPALRPGNLFYMPPEFINGSKLPNVLPVEDYRNDDNLYRVLTMSVNFATAESTNKMTILAVPAQWSGELPSNKTTEMTGDLFARAIARDVEDKTAIEIDVGARDKVESVDVKNVKQHAPDTKVEMFDNFKGLIDTWGSWAAVQIDTTKGSCLSKILEYYLTVDSNGPKLQKGEKGKGTEYAYFLTRNELEKKYGSDSRALRHFQSNGCWANVLWWPLTVVGTYWRKWIDDENHMSNNWCPVQIDNPDFIREGFTLYIPIFSGSWDSMRQKLERVKDIWKYAYQAYSKYGPSLTYIWRAMYYYLGGTDELD